MAAVGVFFGLAVAALKSVPASRGYGVEAEFSRLPGDDRALEQWLKVQDGVVPHTVHVHRDNEDPTKLKVFFIMSQSGWGPPTPDLESKCSELGYHGSVDGFRHMPGE